jgi:hypothetical protein
MKHKITIEFDEPGTVRVSSETKPSGCETLLAMTHALVGVIEKCSKINSMSLDRIREAVLCEFNRMLDNIEAQNEG